MDNVQKEFVVSEIQILSWGASVQRAGIYKMHKNSKTSKKSDKKKKDFSRLIFKNLDDELRPKYTTKVDPKDHLENIKALSAEGNKIGKKFSEEIGAKFLRPTGYKIGVAQKLLNLYLKYLWCLGFVATPPHCPVDAIIIGKCKPARGVKSTLTAWTKITKIEEYVKSIDVIGAEALKKNLSIARWGVSYI